jgi:hypothetical protein
VTLLLRFLKADWQRSLGLTAIAWLLFLAVDLGNSRFIGWESTTHAWAVRAPVLFAVFALLRVILFVLAYSMLYARSLSFAEAYERFVAGRLR